jgi:hypothetical protein
VVGYCRASGYVASDAAIDSRDIDAPPDAQPAAFALDGQRWLLPCTGSGDGSGLCPCTLSIPTQTVELSGDTTIYQVVIRIRGVFELTPYGSGGSGSGDFYIGGTAGNDYSNIYEISVSSPLQHYFINSENSAASTGVVAADYEAKIAIAGDATVTFTANGQDGLEGENSADLTIPGVVTMPSPYNGEFAQLNVISAN